MKWSLLCLTSFFNDGHLFCIICIVFFVMTRLFTTISRFMSSVYLYMAAQFSWAASEMAHLFMALQCLLCLIHCCLLWCLLFPCFDQCLCCLHGCVFDCLYHCLQFAHFLVLHTNWLSCEDISIFYLSLLTQCPITFLNEDNANDIFEYVLLHALFYMPLYSMCTI